MLSALVEDFRHVPGVAVHTQVLEPLRNRISAPHVKVQTCTVASEHDVFRRGLVETDAFLIVAPEFDGILEDRCREAVARGATSLGCTVAAITRTADKWVLAQHWKRLDVPTPATCLASSPETKDLPFPRVLKPRDGAGSLGTYLVHEPTAWDDTLRQATQDTRTDFLAQTFIPGISASIAFLVGTNQTCACPAARQILSRDGRFVYSGGEIPLPRALSERAEALGRRALAGIEGLNGYVGVDLVLGEDSASDRVIEINPRVTTSYVGLRRLTSQNLAEVWLRLHQGERVEPLAWGPGTVRFSSDGKIDVRKHSAKECGDQIDCIDPQT